MFTTNEPSTLHPERVSAMRERQPSSLVDPVFVARRVWRAKYWIATLAILGAGIAAFVALSTPKVYHASTQLILDPRGLNLVQNEVTETPLGLASDAALALIQSQIAVITSKSVLEQVVDEAGLTQDPEFNGTAEGRFDRYLPSVAFLDFGAPEEEIEDRRLLTLVNFREKVWASRAANSFVIDVSVESRSPEKAADLANLVAATFVEEQGRVQAETARSATASLSLRLVELRQRVGEAEEAVERYKVENRLLGVGGRLIDDEFILSTNEQLANVRGEITALNVRAASMRETSVDDVVEGTFPEELSSQSLVRLRQTYSEVAQENAVLSARLGPRHPQRIASEEALGTARRAIATELSRVVAAAQTELARAQGTERDLTAQIEGLRGQQIETSEAFVALRDLERDVDASRAVYESYLLRSREIGEQESLNTANVRTISEATPPFQPSGLSRKIVVAAGGFLGLALGLGLALMFALLRLVRMKLAEADERSYVPVGHFDRPVWTALPPPNHRASAGGPTPAAAASDEDETDLGEAAQDAPTAADEKHAAVRAAAMASAAEPRVHADEAPAGTAAPFGPQERSEATSSAPETPSSGEAVQPEAAPEPGPALQDRPDAARLMAAGAAVPGESEAGRREKLRQRIRDIGSRRRIGAPPLDDAHVSDAIRRLTRSDRSTIADIRRRRQSETDKV